MVTLATVSVMVARLLGPPAPLHVNEYEVVVLTAPVLCVPLTGSGPAHPPEAVHDVALLELQESVAAPPGAMTVELNVRVAVGMTFTTALVSEVPPVPLQLSEYEVAIATAPVLWLPLRPTEPFQAPLAVQDVVLLEVHVNVELPPAATTCGDAVKVTVGTGKMVTVVTTGAVTPPGPAQMSEYAVAAVNGPVLWLPLAATVPLQPPEALHEVALVELHVSMEAFPEATAVGAAASVAVGAGIDATVAVAGGVTPPGPVHTIEYTLVAMIGPVL
jgi:hypothetical protein